MSDGDWVIKKESMKKNRGVASLYDLIEAEKYNWKDVAVMNGIEQKSSQIMDM